MPVTSPPLEDEEEVAPAMGHPSKLITASYVDAYGLRIPSSISGIALKGVWADTVSRISYTALTKATSRNPKLSAYAIRGQIIPKEYLIGLHDRLVRMAKAKPLPPTSNAAPAYDAQPDYALLKMIGVEFEGGWYQDRIYAHSLRIKRDGSVNVSNRHPVERGGTQRGDETCSAEDCDNPACIRARELRANSVVEVGPPERQRLGFVSGELEFGPFTHTNLTQWDEIFDRAYPEEVNATCGQHVHFSFPSTGIYGAFVQEGFRAWLMGGLDAWVGREQASGATMPEGWGSRFLGRNTYCKAIYSPEQLWNAGDRYGQVNYCFKKHGTMEIRVLPMFETPAQSKAAITELVRLVAIWANAFAPRARKPILIGSAEIENEPPAVAVAVSAQAPFPADWRMSFDSSEPLLCPVCEHDVNVCRGFNARGDWSSLRRMQASWNADYGSPVGCCHSPAGQRRNHNGAIPMDSRYAQILTAIYNGEIA